MGPQKRQVVAYLGIHRGGVFSWEVSSMAGDWIKMRHSLKSDPRVVRIMSACDADRFRTLGGLFAAWCLFDEQTTDGFLPGYTPSVFDEIVGFPGLCAAMISVGWIEESSQGLTAVRFDEHNGRTAKRRSQESVRKMSARHADKCPQLKRTETGRNREEKRREEKSIRSPSDSSCGELESSPQQPEEPESLAVIEYPTSRTGETWTLRESHLADFRECYPGIDVLAQCRAALGWCIANPRQRKTASGMLRFLNGWLTKAQNQARGSPPAKPTTTDVIEQARRLREERAKWESTQS
jgi:hypothetical protein